ncbi:tail fiber domain-containing protein [bacterium]|nr:tail fiber domain-containing protein [bacterium]
MAEIRINATGGLKLYDADDSHYAQIVAGTITSNVDAITLGHNIATFNAAITAGGILKTDDTTEATSTTDGSLQTDGGLSVAKDTVIGDDLKLLSDASVLSFGANSEITLTHVHDTGLLLQDSGGTPTLQLHDSNESIASDGSKVIITSGGTAFSLPTSDGSNGQALITNGSAVLSFGSAGASTIGALTDVTMDATNFTDALLIQTSSDGSAPTTGTLSSATGNIGIGKSTFTALTSGVHNIGIGWNSLPAVTSGARNVCVGKQTGEDLTDALRNTLVGNEAGANITTGDDNIGIGAGSIDGFDTENNNIGIGYNALGGPVAGGEGNVAVGNSAGDALTSGDDNVFVGQSAGGATTTGQKSVCIGGGAGSANQTTGYNVCIGYDTGNAITGGYNNVVIGYDSDISAVGGTNQVVIGANNAQGYGNDYIVFGKVNQRTYIQSGGTSWSADSDRRIKRNIKDWDALGLSFIKNLNPVSFQWKPNNEIPKELEANYSEENSKDLDVVKHGFIAQEVREALDTAGVDKMNDLWSVDQFGCQGVSTGEMVLPLIIAVKELSAKVDELEKKLENK